MTIRTPTLVSCFLLLACAISLGKTEASTVSYDLQLNNLPAFTGQTLARVTLSDTGGGGVDFTVEALIGGTRLSQFGFNFLNDTMPAGFDITGLPIVNSNQWVYSADINKKGGFNGFGKFDVDVNDGGNNGRITPLTFHVTTGSVADYVALSDKGESSLFAAHVTNLNDTGSGSCDGISTSCTVITGYAGGGTLRPSEVPVPAAVWLFGSGLLGLIGMAKRRKAA